MPANETSQIGERIGICSGSQTSVGVVADEVDDGGAVQQQFGHLLLARPQRVHAHVVRLGRRLDVVFDDFVRGRCVKRHSVKEVRGVNRNVLQNA
jgi:hypothetical protein